EFGIALLQRAQRLQGLGQRLAGAIEFDLRAGIGGKLRQRQTRRAVQEHRLQARDVARQALRGLVERRQVYTVLRLELGVARQLVQLARGHARTEELRGQFRQLVRLVDDDRVAAREDLAE